VKAEATLLSAAAATACTSNLHFATRIARATTLILDVASIYPVSATSFGVLLLGTPRKKNLISQGIDARHSYLGFI
jgi:hypothetical protein